MTARFCDVCGDQIHGDRDRIFAILPDGRQITIEAHSLPSVDLLYRPEPIRSADVCMECIRDVVKNRTFTRTKAVPDAAN